MDDHEQAEEEEDEDGDDDDAGSEVVEEDMIDLMEAVAEAEAANDESEGEGGSRGHKR